MCKKCTICDKEFCDHTLTNDPSRKRRRDNSNTDQGDPMPNPLPSSSNTNNMTVASTDATPQAGKLEKSTDPTIESLQLEIRRLNLKMEEQSRAHKKEVKEKNEIIEGLQRESNANRRRVEQLEERNDENLQIIDQYAIQVNHLTNMLEDMQLMSMSEVNNGRIHFDSPDDHDVLIPIEDDDILLYPAFFV